MNPINQSSQYYVPKSEMVEQLKSFIAIKPLAMIIADYAFDLPAFNLNDHPQLSRDVSPTEIETIEEMTNALYKHSLSLSYTSDKKFIVLGNSYLSKAALEKIFAEKSYGNSFATGWAPKVLDETTKSGNRVMQLVSLSQEWVLQKLLFRL